jgi:hypothetical protein
MTTKQKWLLRISITLNIIFLLGFFLNYLNSPSYKLGELKQDIKVGLFNDKDTTFFTLPKGLTVRDVSERGISAIGQFENNRFEIVITSDDELVNYKIDKNKLLTFGNFYSTESTK